MGVNSESNIDKRSNVEITNKMCRFISSRRERVGIKSSLLLHPDLFFGRWTFAWTSPWGKKKSSGNCSKGSLG